MVKFKFIQDEWYPVLVPAEEMSFWSEVLIKEELLEEYLRLYKEVLIKEELLEEYLRVYKRFTELHDEIYEAFLLQVDKTK